MKSLLQEYKAKSEEPLKDEITNTEPTPGLEPRLGRADFSRMRSRNSTVRTEVLSDLKENRPSRLTRKSVDFRSPPPLDRVSQSDFRTGSLSPVSPKTMKQRSVLLGFRLNSITLVLKKALNSNNEFAVREFLKRLRRNNNVSKSLTKLSTLLQVKQCNHKYYSFSTLSQYSKTNPQQVHVQIASTPTIVHVPCILPFGSTHPLAKLPPYLHYHGSSSRMALYVGLGKVVGVVMGVSRFYKSVFLNILKRKKFRQLKYLADT